MKYIGMAVTPRAAAKSISLFEGAAKLQKTIVMTTIVGANNQSEADPDPLDWAELDSAMSKPPTSERKPSKQPQPRKPYHRTFTKKGGQR